MDEEGWHPGFHARAFAEARARLVAHGVPFSENSLDDIGLKQVFLRDPNGVPIEINFRN